MVQYLNTELAGYITLQYNSSTFKLNFTSTLYTFIIRKGVNNCLKLLGFNKTTTETNNLNSINLSRTKVLYISLSNITISSNSSKSASVYNVLDSINVDVVTGSAKSYYNGSNIKYKIVENNVSRIDSNIYDEHNVLVDLILLISLCQFHLFFHIRTIINHL